MIFSVFSVQQRQIVIFQLLGYKIERYLHNVCKCKICNLLTYNSCHFVTLNQSQEKTSSCDKAAFTLCDAENVMQNIESSLLCMTKLS